SKLFETFVPMYNATMDKDKASDYYYFEKKFYESIVNDLKYNMMFFYAKCNEEIVSIAMVLMANKHLHYHLSASNPRYNRIAPSNLLLNEVANWGVENGFETFHLGGGVGSQEDSLYKFKKSFTKDKSTSYLIGKKIYNQEIYEYLVNIRKNMTNKQNELDNLFFPLYRQ